MEDDNGKDIPIGFIVQPIHEQHKGEQAHEKIDGINQAGLY